MYFNWKIFLCHLRNKLTKKYLSRKEFLWSVVVTFLVLFIILIELPPVNAVMAFGESITNSWEKDYDNPPVPHTEEMTLSEIAKLVNQDQDSVLQALKSQNKRVINSNAKLKDIARENECSPQQLYKLIKPRTRLNPDSNRRSAGRGWGRKSVSQICREENIDVSTAIKNMELNGITANANSKIRELSRRYNIKSSELVDIIRK